MNTPLLTRLTLVILLQLAVGVAPALAQKKKAKAPKLKGTYVFTEMSLTDQKGLPVALDDMFATMMAEFKQQVAVKQPRFTFKGGGKLVFQDTQQKQKGKYSIKGNQITLTYGNQNDTAPFKLEGNQFLLEMPADDLAQMNRALWLVFTKP